MLTLGFDPGGKIGCCVLRADSFRTETVSSIEEAMRWAAADCDGETPDCAGIDTLLHWSDGRARWRPADRFLQETYPEASSSVIAPNSLYGAMAVGGVGLAIRLRERWPSMALTETHPKMLFHALRGSRYRVADLESAVRWFVEKHGLPTAEKMDEHQFDALVSAWAAREGPIRQWRDLCEPRSPDVIFPVGVVSYLWPVSS
jgi:hypothetical protein